MKTPERDYYFYESGINPDNGAIIMDAVMPELYNTRWKRKNRTAQLKRTIARLTDALTAERRQFNELWLGDHLKRYSPEWDAFMQLRRLKTPAEDATLDEKFVYWVALREVGKSVLNAACLAAKTYGVAKGKEEEKARACHSENAENAKQETLFCAGAEQLTARKEQSNG